MTKSIHLTHKNKLLFNPIPPYNFDANMHKPSHFPSSDNTWEEGKYWISMLWAGKNLGLKLINQGNVESPKVEAEVYSDSKLTRPDLDSLRSEISWRFNFDEDYSEFYQRYGKDKILGKAIGKWKGMKPVAANSLYETLIIYFVLQNAPVRRSVQMLESLFDRFGSRIIFDGKTLSAFWNPEDMVESSEEELKKLKVGYRAKFFKRLSDDFANGRISEDSLRKVDQESLRSQLLNIYGVGPATLEYLLFEDFYFLDALNTIPPWEQKILSRLVFEKERVDAKEIIDFFRKKYSGFEKLAVHYIWEDLFWKRKDEHIDWLEKEIRL
ncbi:MAG: hypothetical protein Q8P81_01180 [Nanoarchaeota archaeon]|nr:hypothetical protein [Nanoarchaeota archaeon]